MARGIRTTLNLYFTCTAFNVCMYAHETELVPVKQQQDKTFQYVVTTVNVKWLLQNLQMGHGEQIFVFF